MLCVGRSQVMFIFLLFFVFDDFEEALGVGLFKGNRVLSGEQSFKSEIKTI